MMLTGRAKPLGSDSAVPCILHLLYSESQVRVTLYKTLKHNIRVSQVQQKGATRGKMGGRFHNRLVFLSRALLIWTAA